MTRPRGSTRGGPDAAPTHPNFQHHFFRNVRLKNSSVMRAFAETLHTSQAREVQNAANQHPHLGRSRVAKPIATFHSVFMHPKLPRFLRERRLIHVFRKHTPISLHPLSWICGAWRVRTGHPRGAGSERTGHRVQHDGDPEIFPIVSPVHSWSKPGPTRAHGHSER